MRAGRSFRNQPHRHLDFGPPAPRIVREQIPAVLSHLVRSHWTTVLENEQSHAREWQAGARGRRLHSPQALAFGYGVAPPPSDNPHSVTGGNRPPISSPH